MNFAQRLVVEALQEFAEKQMTVRQVADHTGMTVQTIYRYAERFSIPLLFPGPGRSPKQLMPPDERSAAMAELYQSGRTLKEIGDQYGVTRERVRQILRKDHGYSAEDGGAAERARTMRKKFQQDRDKRCIRKWGCNYRTYHKILKDPSKPTYAYWQQRRNAIERGISWELNLWQWWQIWQHSGHWSERGRGSGYGMCRHNDIGPYAVDNVYIATGIENIKDYYASKRQAEAA